MKLLDYASYPTSPQFPIIQVPPVKKVKMSWGRRQFWLRFCFVCLFLLLEALALISWGIVTDWAVLPPFVEKTPIVVPCAHVRVFFDPTQTVQQQAIDEACP